jgi:hypothetical protein
LKEKEEEDAEELDTFDMDIKVMDPVKVGKFWVFFIEVGMSLYRYMYTMFLNHGLSQMLSLYLEFNYS